MANLNLKPACKNYFWAGTGCDYFTVDKLNLDGKVMKRKEGTCDAIVTTIRASKEAPKE